MSQNWKDQIYKNPMNVAKTILSEIVKLRGTAINEDINNCNFDSTPYIIKYVSLYYQKYFNTSLTLKTKIQSSNEKSLLSTHEFDSYLQNSEYRIYSENPTKSEVIQILKTIFKKITDRQTRKQGLADLFLFKLNTKLNPDLSKIPQNLLKFIEENMSILETRIKENPSLLPPQSNENGFVEEPDGDKENEESENIKSLKDRMSTIKNYKQSR